MTPRKRGKKYEISYRHTGCPKPFYEYFPTKEEAELRIIQIEYEKKLGTFAPPKPAALAPVSLSKKFITLGELLDEYVTVYGLNHWGDSYLSMSRHRIEHYIKPYMGDALVKDLTAHELDLFYDSLLGKPAVHLKGRHDEGATISPSVIEKIHTLIRGALTQAVKWKYIPENPAKNVSLPEYKSKPRAVWSKAQALDAIELCSDPILKNTILIALCCSLRIGEILGLTWDCVHLSDGSKDDVSFVTVEKELKRCKKADIEDLEKRNRSKVILKFPPLKKAPCTTVLVLKAPKTDSSNRTVYLPETISQILADIKQQQEQMKAVLGPEYQDFNLVIAQDNGRPYEERLIAARLKGLIRDGGLPEVVFHSLRNTSTSMKLRVSSGNIKAVQGDTGHSQSRMVTDTYARICDEDRRILAQDVETDLFRASSAIPADESMDKAIEALKNHPEIVKVLANLATA